MASEIDTDEDKAFIIMQSPIGLVDAYPVGVALTEGLAKNACIELAKRDVDNVYYYQGAQFLHTLSDV